MNVIEVDDPRRDDVRALLERHLAFAAENSPPKDIHALDVEGLLGPALTFFSLRAVGALKQLNDTEAELKSMHTALEARGQGAGRAMLEHLMAVARARDYHALYLETGSMAAFEPARALYAGVGFEHCGPFAEYEASRNSTHMRLVL